MWILCENKLCSSEAHEAPLAKGMFPFQMMGNLSIFVILRGEMAEPRNRLEIETTYFSPFIVRY